MNANIGWIAHCADACLSQTVLRTYGAVLFGKFRMRLRDENE